MKKIIVTAAAICTLFVCSSCANTKADNSDSNVNLANTQMTEESVSSEEEFSSLPDKSNFEVAPATASDSFNYMIEATKKVYPDNQGKRLYGYLGTEKVKGVNCFVFSIYEENDDRHSEVATVAVDPKSFNMFSLNPTTNKYESLVIPNDESSAAETEWAEKETATFEKYLSSGSAKADKVSSTAKKTSK